MLQSARETAQEQLKGKYNETVGAFVGTIKQTMKFKEMNHFEAMKFIQDETTLAVNPQNKIMYAAALMEIVEEKNLKIQ